MKKWIFSIKGGFLVTAMYVLIVIGSQIYRGQLWVGNFNEWGDFLASSMSPNEWGDYLAGTMAPLALAWFVATLILQRKDLQLQGRALTDQREELKLQREELERHREEMQITNQARKDANALARSERFRQTAYQYRSELDYILKDWYTRMPSKIMYKNGEVCHCKSEKYDNDNLLLYIKALESNGYFVPGFSKENGIDNILGTYIHVFYEFHDKAAETGDTVQVSQFYSYICGVFQGQ